MRKWIIAIVLLALVGYATFEFISSNKEEQAVKEEMETSTKTEMETANEEPDLNETESNNQTDGDEVGIEAGQIAPDFELETLDGETVNLSDYRGKKVLLNFWATWCPPCRSEMPDMQQVHEEFSDEDVEILAVNLTGTESSMSVITDFLDELDITFTILKDEDTTIANIYQANALPTSYLLNTDGSIYNVAIGPLNYDLMVEAFQEMH